ncbi:hypothetical protein GCM10010324_10610 [Streptomyces hiroshimensis]|uniref:Uncharacterized protein n=1 Tax=Streptomyces hiroshimensis TaxID=66424 RepID=A0ABQ2Y727_9ACTN|nr:hypothetical protein GCM10010324_10610 [Streptomyces hiroshimensis]
MPVAADMLLDRYGPYLVICDGEKETVPVFTAHDAWVDGAENPDASAPSSTPSRAAGARDT